MPWCVTLTLSPSRAFHFSVCCRTSPPFLPPSLNLSALAPGRATALTLFISPSLELSLHETLRAYTNETCNMVSTIPTFLKARHRPPKLLYVHSQRSGIAFTIGTCHNLCRTKCHPDKIKEAGSIAMVSQCLGQGRHGNTFLFVPKRNASRYSIKCGSFQLS
jgi:hypothetical protein